MVYYYLVWHTIKVYEEGTIFEAKDGVYVL